MQRSHRPYVRTIALRGVARTLPPTFALAYTLGQARTAADRLTADLSEARLQAEQWRRETEKRPTLEQLLEAKAQNAVLQVRRRRRLVPYAFVYVFYVGIYFHSSAFE